MILGWCEGSEMIDDRQSLSQSVISANHCFTTFGSDGAALTSAGIARVATA